MQLYAGLSAHFCRDASHNQIGEKLRTAFVRHYRNVGVIWGTNLTYDLDRQAWVGNPAASHDKVVKAAKGAFVELVKNTYRVLLTRGMKGCFVCFVDKDTERFVRSRVE